MSKEEREIIRDYLGAEKIVIHKDGRVDAYGDDSDPYNRSLDYWRFGGWEDEVLRDAKRELCAS